MSNIARNLTSAIRKQKIEAKARVKSRDDYGPSSSKNKVKKDEKLLVLKEAAVMKTAQKLFQQFVSDRDYTHLVAFIKDFDHLLAKYHLRDGKDEDEEEEDDDLDGGYENDEEEEEKYYDENPMDEHVTIAKERFSLKQTRNGWDVKDRHKTIASSLSKMAAEDLHYFLKNK